MESYSVVSLIGEGSFGKVYKARIKGTGQSVAMKFIQKKGKNEKELRSLRGEIEILTKLNHDNIITLFDAFETEQEFVVVMEYAIGELFDILRDDKRLPEDVVQKIAKQLVQALNYIHSNRIIHRDMKPQNILLGKNGSVKLADFGFARSMSYNTVVLTSLKGTPLYMAPELVQEQPYTRAVDIWSLGCILYELYYGKPPFYANNLYSLINGIAKDPVHFDEPISSDFKNFLKGLLTKSVPSRLDWPELLNHPFVSASNADALWQGVIKEQDAQLKERMNQLGCFKLHHGRAAIQCAESGQLSLTAESGRPNQFPAFTPSATQLLQSEDETVVIDALKKIIVTAQSTSISKAEDGALEQFVDRRVFGAVKKLLQWKSSPAITELVLSYFCTLIFPEDVVVLSFPNLRSSSAVTEDLRERHSSRQVDLYIRQLVAEELLQPPHTALNFIMEEMTLNARSSQIPCAKVFFQCAKWEGTFGPTVVRKPQFPSLWAAILDSVTDKSATDQLSRQYAALAFHIVSIVIPHIKLAAPDHMNNRKVFSFVRQGLSAVCFYDPKKKVSRDTEISELNYAAAAALLVAFASRELTDVFAFEADDDLLSGLCAIVDGVNAIQNRPVVPRTLGSSFGFPDYGLLDGVAHMISLILSDPKSVVYTSPGFAKAFLETDLHGIAHIAMKFLRDSDSKMELSLSGVQTTLRAVQQVLQQQREQTHNMSLIMEPLDPYPGESSSSGFLISIVCRLLGADYLQQIFFWPECRGGGTNGVSAHLTIVSQIITEALCRIESNPSVTDRIVTEVQQVIYKENVMKMLVISLDYTEIAFWGTAFALMSKLTNLSPSFGEAFVEGGGLQNDRMSRALDLKKASSSLISDAVNILSQLTRPSAEFYPAIHTADLYVSMANVLKHGERDVRTKMCTLIGYMCKSSAYFHETLARYGMIDTLAVLCSDKDMYTQRFASFAIGNAAFHGSQLYQHMKPAIPALVKLLSSQDEKTRMNSAGALNNLLRNGSQLVATLDEFEVAENLLKGFDTGSSRLKKTMIITLSTYCGYEVFRTKFIELGLKDFLSQFIQKEGPFDQTTDRYATRMKERLGMK